MALKPILPIQLFAIDSLTAILEGEVALAMEGNSRGLNKNRAAAFADKSNAIKLLQDAMTQAGTDTALIWHLQDRRDNNAQKTVRQTLPETERKSLKRSLNAVLRLYKTAQGQRAVRVTWSRAQGNGLKNLEILDTQGNWRGVPERLDRLLAGTMENPEKRCEEPIDPTNKEAYLEPTGLS